MTEPLTDDEREQLRQIVHDPDFRQAMQAGRYTYDQLVEQPDVARDLLATADELNKQYIPQVHLDRADNSRNLKLP